MKNLLLFSCIGLFLFGMIKFAYFNADVEYHWDAKNYYAGYLSVYHNSDYSAAYSHFGKFTELLFPIIYLSISVFPKMSSPETLIIFHSITFSILYVILLFFMVHKKYLQLSGLILILGMCPPGVAAQLARQAIAFPIIIIVIILASKRWWSFILVIQAALITHLMSIFAAVYYLEFFRRVSKSYLLLLIPLIIYTITFFTIENFGVAIFPLYFKNYMSFGDTAYMAPSLVQWLCLIYLITVLLLHVFLTGKVRTSDVFFFAFLLLPILVSSFMITRVIFGLHFFLIPWLIMFKFRHLVSVNFVNYNLGFLLLSIKVIV